MTKILDVTVVFFFAASLWSVRAGNLPYAIMLTCLSMVVNLVTATISIYEEPNLWSWIRLVFSLLMTLALSIRCMWLMDQVGTALPSQPYGVPGTSNEKLGN
ncbi:hypothetical protein F5Y03DRAFT_397988 [Xylaria venustula]|nr:hypothetical protein F5Y03DRAFT_397988 [Xylaria venustula]